MTEKREGIFNIPKGGQIEGGMVDQNFELCNNSLLQMTFSSGFHMIVVNDPYPLE